MGDDATRRVPEGAVVLAGGTGRRMGGVDKASLRVGGRTLLDRALAATRGIAEVVVVGPPTTAQVRAVREDPPGGGPAAGLLAGVRALAGARTVLVLAVDMPGVTTSTVRRLTAALAAEPEADGAVLDDGRRQPLCGVYRSASLLRAAPEDPSGTAVRALLGGLRLLPVAALAGEARDVDTWADLQGRDDPGDGDRPGTRG